MQPVVFRHPPDIPDLDFEVLVCQVFPRLLRREIDDEPVGRVHLFKHDDGSDFALLFAGNVGIPDLT